MSKKTSKAAIRRRRQRIARRCVSVLVVLLVCLMPNLWDMGIELDELDQTGSAQSAASTPKPSPTPQPTPTPAPTPAVITISAAGDCTLGGDPRSQSEKRFRSMVEKKGLAYFFENVKPIFEQDDLTVVNFEGTLTTSKKSAKGKEFCFRGKPEYAQMLTLGDIELVNLANNHTLDFGKAGLQDTKDNLTAEGIPYFGMDDEYIVEVKGAKLGFLGYNYWNIEMSEAQERIEAMREKCDILIVSFHWGTELDNHSSSSQHKWAHMAVDAGADLVLGHHPHVIQGIERYKGKYIVYSLGNFCFGGNSNPDDKTTFIFQQTFEFLDGKVTDGDIKVIPCSITSGKTNNYQPTPLTGEKADKVLKRIEKYSSKYDEAPNLTGE